MRTKATPTTRLTPDQRTLVLGVSIAQLMMLTLNASLNYMLPAMADSFGSSSDQIKGLREISSLAALLVVFLAAVLGERLGDRRVMVGSACLFVGGSALVAVAPGLSVATVGLLLANVGKAVITVLALAVVSARITDSDGRATAFATVTSLAPIAYLIVPLLAGGLVTVLSWRWVAVVWVLAGLVCLWAILFKLPHDGEPTQGRGELVTPALAGLALAVSVEWLGDIRDEGWTTKTVTYVVVFAVSMLALVVLYRRLQAPSLSLAPLRHGGLMLLLLVLILFSFSNLFYYNTLLYQVVYGYSALEAAVIMIPTQLMSITGALMARKLLQRRGLGFTGVLTITAVACTLLLSTSLQETFPLIVPMVFVSAYALASVAAVVALTTAIMDRAETGREGQTSSYRSAAGSIGGALGVAVMTTVVTVVGTSSMNQQLTAAGIASPQASDAAWALIHEVSPQTVSSDYGISSAEVTQITDMDRAAFVQSYRAQALVGGVITFGAGGLFLLTRRRRRGDGASESIS